MQSGDEPSLVSRDNHSSPAAATPPPWETPTATRAPRDPQPSTTSPATFPRPAAPRQRPRIRPRQASFGDCGDSARAGRLRPRPAASALMRVLGGMLWWGGVASGGAVGVRDNAVALLHAGWSGGARGLSRASGTGGRRLPGGARSSTEVRLKIRFSGFLGGDGFSGKQFLLYDSPPAHPYLTGTLY